VPWKQGRGYATQALGLILPVAREEGLQYVIITCDVDNVASRKVIEANGGVLTGEGENEVRPDVRKLIFQVDTA
jgi:predicted acetyltransferase